MICVNKIWHDDAERVSQVRRLLKNFILKIQDGGRLICSREPLCIAMLTGLCLLECQLDACLYVTALLGQCPSSAALHLLSSHILTSQPPSSDSLGQSTLRTCLLHTHTHTPFNGPLSGTTQVSRYQKGKTNLDFTGARDSEWQWHQLGHYASLHLAPGR